MLASLTIQNVVLIDQLTVEFEQGLCALTGETGAGKSILLDSLGLALGARSDSGLVRKGQEKAGVTAMFDVPKTHPVISFLEEQDISSDSSLILRRSLSSEGGSKAYINDQPVSVSLLKKVGDLLVEVHGQFDTHHLLNSKYHKGLLDGYAQHGDLLQRVQKAWNVWKKSKEKLSEVQAQIVKASNDEEYYRTSLEDLDKLSPEKGEEDKLSKLRQRLMKRDKIFESIQVAQRNFQEIEELFTSAWRALGQVEEESKPAIQAVDRANNELQEATAILQELSEEIGQSAYSLEEIDDRLFALKAQARKHDCEIEELSEKREEIAAALNSIENQEEALEGLIKKVEISKKEYMKLAENLSQSRKKYAQKLEKLIMNELPPLKLEKARFEVSVREFSEEKWSAQGVNDVKFLVATNPGSEAGALNKIASGGEMARFMLALKVSLSEVGSACTLVFDEVDSGIGGATAAAVGERLARLANDNAQILVVTHSPQVAGIARHHWIVSKDGKGDVKTNIIPLFEMSQRQEEIARMLSGAEITAEARAAAVKLLEVSAA